MEPTTAKYREPKKLVSIVFTDRLNTEYVVQDVEPSDLGENPTYKDYIARALDPNTETNKNVYGLAKTLKPLGARIADMKASIDNANGALYNLEKLKEEYLARKEQEDQAPQQQVEPAPEVKNDTK